MNEMIRTHIEALFEKAPRTRKAVDLKEEIFQNTMEKYQDLISEGYTEEDAVKIVLDSIGDVTELFQELEEQSPWALPEAARKKKAMLKATAAGLYIFAGAVYMACLVLNDFYFWQYEFGAFSFVFAVVLCIPPTCMMVYASQMYPTSRKKDDTLVGAYKEAANTRSKEKAVRTSVNVLIWLLTVTLYFTISFATFYWHVTWILFLVGGCAQAIAALVFSLRRES